MNAKAEKWMVEAAKYFREEILDIMPDIPREELSSMVGEYVYYQQADATRNDALRAVQVTCVQPAR